MLSISKPLSIQTKYKGNGCKHNEHEICPIDDYASFPTNIQKLKEELLHESSSSSSQGNKPSHLEGYIWKIRFTEDLKEYFDDIMDSEALGFDSNEIIIYDETAVKTLEK